MAEKVTLTEAEKALVVELSIGAIQQLLAGAYDLGYSEGNDDGSTNGWDSDANPWRD